AWRYWRPRQPTTETKMKSGPQKALVLGMSGGFGGATARALTRRGFEVQALTRREQTPEPGVRWIRGDALNAADVLDAARDASVIVHAAHPARYLNWHEHGIPMLA